MRLRKECVFSGVHISGVFILGGFTVKWEIYSIIGVTIVFAVEDVHISGMFILGSFTVK